MKILDHILNTSYEMIDTLEDVVRSNCFQFRIQQETQQPGFSISTRELQTIEAKKFMKSVCDKGVAACIETYVRVQAVMNGPKVFKPQADNLEALENMTLNVAIKDYDQPFPTIIIDFPEAYCRKYEMDNDLPGYRDGSGLIASNRHTIDFVICHHIKESNVLMVVVYLTSSDAYSTMLWSTNGDETLEECIQIARGKEEYEKSLVVSHDEDLAACNAIRAAINSILAIEELGAINLGPLNKARDRELRDLSLSHLRSSRRKANRELNRQAILYSFDQNVKLYHTADFIDITHNGVSYAKKPHFRRGYYRKQHYGTGNLLTKRVRIPSVLVNAHLFGGKPSDTRATYE